MAQVDILVLTHNALDVTKQFVACLYEHTADFNLWVLDNGSNDGTYAWLIEEHAKGTFGKPTSPECNVYLRKSSTNLGVIGGRNELYRLNKEAADSWGCDHSPLILFLDNDQFVQPGWFEQHKAVLGSGYDLVGVEGWKMNHEWTPSKKCSHAAADFDYVGAGGMLMRREVPEKIGMFDEVFSPAYFEDPDFCLRAYDAGFSIGWNHGARIFHLAHQTLGKTNWKPQFLKSHAIFKERWKDHHHPSLRMPYKL